MDVGRRGDTGLPGQRLGHPDSIGDGERVVQNDFDYLLPAILRMLY